MKVIKNINNNVSLCLDSNQNEVIAFGKGIGFTKPPYEIALNKIERVYYDVEPTYVQMINDIPEQIIDISTKVIDYARMKLDNNVSSNIVFTLADHIQFAIRRHQENMDLKLPIIHDIQCLFETEMDIGMMALELLRKNMKIYLPKEEAAYIALHIVNAEKKDKNKVSNILDEDVIEEIIDIIEAYFNIEIDRKSINYSRFVSHMHYLIKRVKENTLVENENHKLYESLAAIYPETEDCTKKICQYLKNKINCELTEEESVYLMLHVNRLCAR
ncbi:MAG: PRD domain-containing protein [Erysipelotrichaceae bacterium]|nr:PRD domain-containing protein [Erysipelotrichaceae bacterium]